MKQGTTEPTTDFAGAHCAACGYDLRGIASEHCPECGSPLADQRALVGAIPWTYRRVRGRVRGFVHTAWDVARRAPWTRVVLAGPVLMADARRFWHVAVALAATPLALAFGFAWWRAGGLWFLAYVPSPSLAGVWFGQTLVPPWWTRSPLHEWLPIEELPTAPRWMAFDVIWPLSAGWTRPGVGLVAIALAVLLGSGVVAYFAHPPSLDAARRRRLAAYAYYLIGTTLVVAAIPLTAALVALAWSFESPGPALGSAMLTLFVALAGVGLTLLAGYVRLLAAIRSTTGGFLPATVAAVGIPIASTLAAMFALVAIPWSIGYAWLLIDALRP